MTFKAYDLGVALLIIGIALIVLKWKGLLELPKVVSDYPIAGSLVLAGLIGVTAPLVQKMWGE